MHVSLDFFGEVFVGRTFPGAPRHATKSLAHLRRHAYKDANCLFNWVVDIARVRIAASPVFHLRVAFGGKA